MNRVFITTGGTLALVLLLNACGADGNDANGASDASPVATAAATSNDITGSVKEWEVNVDATAAEAGTVDFTIANEGTIGHEFLIVKTDIAPGDIPVEGDHFPEDASDIEVIDEIGEFTKGTTEALTVTLEPGSYQLVCNLPDHYENGMFVGFEVLQ
jgi:uncharacterized cupredoxin-like copper-binding protein